MSSSPRAHSSAVLRALTAAVSTEVIATPARLEIAECVLREVAKVGDFFSGNPYEVIPGAYSAFNLDAFLERMKAGTQYKGSAISVFNLKLDDDAMLGVPVSSHEIARYRRERFSNVTPGILPEWEHPVTVAVTPNNIKQWEEFALSSFSGRPPLFRKIPMDVML